MRTRLSLIYFIGTVLCVLAGAPVRAWPPGGLVVAPIPPPGGQFEPRVLLGLQSSVLAYWSDGRWYDGGSDVYAQLLTRFGQVAADWPDTGLMVVRAADDQRAGAGLSHPDGSFIIGFADDRNHVPDGSGTDCYLTRILADGRIDPAWPRHGFRAIDRSDNESPGFMIWAAPDTVLIASAYQHPTDILINLQPLIQRVAITSTGPELPWGAAGILPLWRPFGMVTTFELTPDGQGGAYVLFDEYDRDDGVPYDLYLMRVGRDGQPALGWGPEPFPVCTAPGFQEVGSMCGDGAGGVYVAWADARVGAGLPGDVYPEYQDIRLSRITAEGQVYPGWPTDGMLVSDAPGWQYMTAVLPDGSGGVYVAFDDITIGLTRVQGDGTFAPGWARNGIQVSTLNAYSTYPRLVGDGFGGVYVLFDDSSNNDLRLQHVLPWGTVDPLWPATGYLASTAADGDIVSDGAGGCYVASRKRLDPSEPFNTGIFVTRYSPDGVVPVKLAEATVEVEVGRVHLQWHGVEGVASEFTVQRRLEGNEAWTSLGSPITRGRDVVDYEDAAVEPGARYAYRLTRGAELMSEEQWVEVPARAVFALRGARPNPAIARDLAVELSLAGGGPSAARIEVLDLAGRRVYVRELANLEPGRHVVPLADARLAPGVHWLRLSEGARTAQARVVVVR